MLHFYSFLFSFIIFFFIKLIIDSVAKNKSIMGYFNWGFTILLILHLVLYSTITNYIDFYVSLTTIGTLILGFVYTLRKYQTL